MSNRLLLSRPGRVRPQQLFAAAERARWPRMQAAWRRYRSRRRIADLDSHALGYWMIWSRLLMGGGGLALSVLLAVVAVCVGRRYSRAPAAQGEALA